MNFQDKVILITGGASGMGAATVREFVAAGAIVIIVDRNAAGAQQLATGLKLNAPIIGDVSNSAFCEQAVAETLTRHNRLDVLINAAGIIVRADAQATSDADWRRIMGVNVDGLFFMSRAAIKPMRAQKQGVIINFGSIWGGIGATGVTAYCASKGAVHQLTRAMALDYVQEGIRINAVCPGEVNTPMLRSERPADWDEASLQHLAANTVPMGRLAEPVEIAKVVLFLASDDASYMTGALVPVDAGYTAR
jgi:NAD(P)-dependent dehydrogenase (short-subunit alcohol dehydrogenase family)